MIIDTKNFGLIEVIDEKVLKFPSGIYGFEDCHDFVLLNQSEGSDLFVWMQSTKYKDLCFVTISPFKIMADYDVSIGEDVKKTLDAQEDDTLEVLCIVTIPGDDPAKMTVNMKSPLIMNTRNQIAMQDIIESDKYSFRYPLLDGLKKQQKDT